MMSIWERRISPVDRKVKPTAMGKLGLRGQLLKANVKKRRGLPSRSLPIGLVLERLSIKFESRVDDLDVAGRLDRLRRAETRERLMERKRRQRHAARRRARPSVMDTRIYLWRRRQEWLRSVDDTSDRSGDEASSLDS